MKFRTDFVTNSSSSSFLLAFKDKKEAYASVCEAFLKQRQDDQDNYDYDDNKNTALSDVVLAMESNQIDAEKAVDLYLQSISWYPVRYNIREKFANDPAQYPRKDWDDFHKKYDKIIDELRDKELELKRQEMLAWLKEKNYISVVEFKDSWPEFDAYKTCYKLDEENMKVVECN